MVWIGFGRLATFRDVRLLGVESDGVEQRADRVGDAPVVELEPRAAAGGLHVELVVVPLNLGVVAAIELDARQAVALPLDDEEVLFLRRPGPRRGAELEP